MNPLNQETVKAIEETAIAEYEALDKKPSIGKDEFIRFRKEVLLRHLKITTGFIKNYPELLRSAGFFTKEDMYKVRAEAWDACKGAIDRQHEIERDGGFHYMYVDPEVLQNEKEQYISQFKQQQP